MVVCGQYASVLAVRWHLHSSPHANMLRFAGVWLVLQRISSSHNAAALQCSLNMLDRAADEPEQHPSPTKGA